MRRDCFGVNGPKSHAMTARCKGKQPLATVPEKVIVGALCAPPGRMARVPTKRERSYGDNGKRVVYGKTEYEYRGGDVVAVKRDKSTEDVPSWAFALPSDVVKIDRIGPFKETSPAQPPRKCGENNVPASGKRCARIAGPQVSPNNYGLCALFGDCARLPRKVKAVTLITRVSRSNWVDGDTLAPQSTPGFSAAFDCSPMYGEQVVKASVNALDHDALARRNPGGAPWGRRNGVGERVVDPRPLTESGSFPRKVRLCLQS